MHFPYLTVSFHIKPSCFLACSSSISPCLHREAAAECGTKPRFSVGHGQCVSFAPGTMSNHTQMSLVKQLALRKKCHLLSLLGAKQLFCGFNQPLKPDEVTASEAPLAAA